MRKSVAAIVCAGVALAISGTGAQAATATGSLAVTLTIASTCTVAGGTMAFGSQGILSAVVNQTASITVTCTNSTTYTVGLGQGVNGTAVTDRKMRSPTTTATVNYFLYSDSGRTTNWGNSAGTWVSGTGTGAAQTLTIYGQIPVQTTPAPAADYADTVTITVTY